MNDAASDLLARARESLDDARLLAEHRRRNESVLTRLALHQALQAISAAEGLGASDDVRLDTLLRRVPDDHPQAALVAGLRSGEAQTIAGVAELVEALARPKPRPAAKSKPAARIEPRATPEPRNRREPEPTTSTERELPEDRPEPDLSGPTALGLSPQGHGRADPAASFPSAAFWSLMDQWGVGDLEALRMIGHDGGLTKKGTRPRFRLQDEEAHAYAALRALDRALVTLGLEPKRWLGSPQNSQPFDGATPLAVLERQGAEGARLMIRGLTRQGLQAGLKQALEQSA